MFKSKTKSQKKKSNKKKKSKKKRKINTANIKDKVKI